MIAVLVVGMFATVDIQRANADNSNGDGNKSCNGHNSETTNAHTRIRHLSYCRFPDTAYALLFNN